VKQSISNQDHRRTAADLGVKVCKTLKPLTKNRHITTIKADHETSYC